MCLSIGVERKVEAKNKTSPSYFLASGLWLLASATGLWSYFATFTTLVRRIWPPKR